MNYQPKGSMCASCKDRDKDCSALEFNNMLGLISTDVDGKKTTIVRCSEYQKGEVNE